MNTWNVSKRKSKILGHWKLCCNRSKQCNCSWVVLAVVDHLGRLKKLQTGWLTTLYRPQLRHTIKNLCWITSYSRMNTYHKKRLAATVVIAPSRIFSSLWLAWENLEPLAVCSTRLQIKPFLKLFHHVLNVYLNRCVARLCCKSARHWLTAATQQLHTDNRCVWRRPSGHTTAVVFQPQHCSLLLIVLSPTLPSTTGPIYHQC